MKWLCYTSPTDLLKTGSSRNAYFWLIACLSFAPAIASAMSSIPEKPYGTWKCRGLVSSICSTSAQTGRTECADFGVGSGTITVGLDKSPYTLRLDGEIYYGEGKQDEEELRYVGRTGIFAGDSWEFASREGSVFVKPVTDNGTVAARLIIRWYLVADELLILHSWCMEESGNKQAETP
jgi:hypothetical protein